jgi:hypothetical protein
LHYVQLLLFSSWNCLFSAKYCASTYGLLWWTGFSLVKALTTVNRSNVQQQYLRQNWPLALRGVVTLASPHIGVWITQDSA